MASVLYISTYRLRQHQEYQRRREQNKRGGERQGGTNTQNQQFNPPPMSAEGGPSRGTPWWPSPPLACLLEFIVVHVISVVLASFAAGASRALFQGVHSAIVPVSCQLHHHRQKANSMLLANVTGTLYWA